MIEEEITKESYKELFPDNFQLTQYAIQLAQQQIQSGNEDLNVTQMLKEMRKNLINKLKPEEEK